MAAASMIFSSLGFIAIRYLKDVPTSFVTSAFGVMGAIMTIVLAFAFDVFELPRNLQHWEMAIAIGLLNFLGQTLFTIALSVSLVMVYGWHLPGFTML